MADKAYEAFGIAGRVALVSGGNRNIGRATVLTLAKAGAVPLILYNSDDEAARKVCAEVEKAGGRSGIYKADLADTASLAPLVKKIEREVGGIDILINNAAIRPNTKISAITEEEWDLVFNTNLKAPFFLSQAVLPRMVRQRMGTYRQHRRHRRLLGQAAARARREREAGPRRPLASARRRGRALRHHRQRRHPGDDRHPAPASGVVPGAANRLRGAPATYPDGAARKTTGGRERVPVRRERTRHFRDGAGIVRERRRRSAGAPDAG